MPHLLAILEPVAENSYKPATEPSKFECCEKNRVVQTTRSHIKYTVSPKEFLERREAKLDTDSIS